MRVDYSRLFYLVLTTHALLVAYMWGKLPMALAVAYPPLAIILILGRGVYYYRKKWHWFLMDFCYFGNVLLIVHLWVFRENPYLFMVTFSVCNGPLMGGMLVFHNSFEFHSLDRFVSCFIHFYPVAVTYILRWHQTTIPGSSWIPRFVVCTALEGSPGSHYFTPPLLAPDIHQTCRPTVLYSFLLPVAFYCGHQIVYFLVVQVIFASNLKGDENVLTSYRYLTRTNKGLYRCLNILGRRFRIVMWIFGTFMWMCISLIPTAFFYLFQGFHFAGVMLCLCVILYNGSSRYAYVWKVYREARAQPKTFDNLSPSHKVGGDNEVGADEEGGGDTQQQEVIDDVIPPNTSRTARSVRSDALSQHSRRSVVAADVDAGTLPGMPAVTGPVPPLDALYASDDDNTPRES